MKQQLPVPIATIAKQPVMAHPTGQDYRIDSTAIKPDGAVAVFSGISVYANSVGDKTYSLPLSSLVEPAESTADVVHAKISGSCSVEGAVVIAGASALTADGVAIAI